MINIGIIGSRKFKNRDLVSDVTKSLMESFHKNLTIVSGGCKDSPDEWAESTLDWWNDIADAGVKKKIFLPKTKDEKGYFDRNKLIAENSDLLICFIPRNLYRSGTWNTVKWMRMKKKQNSYIVLDEDGNRWDNYV